MPSAPPQNASITPYLSLLARMILEYLDWLNHLRVVLASGSPRRLDILRGVGLTNVEVRTSDFSEDLDKSHFSDGGAYAIATARCKAEDVHRRLSAEAAAPVDILIAADTVVAFPADPATGAPLLLIEKAADAAAAKAMIAALRGHRHEVWTGVVMGYRAAGSGEWAWREFGVRTVVSVAAVSDTFIDAYVDGHPGAWQGKAGAYGIQDLGGCFIEGIEGDFYNVMGLPLQRVCAALSAIVREAEEGEIASAVPL